MDNQTLLDKPVVDCRPDRWAPSPTDVILVKTGVWDCAYWVEVQLSELIPMFSPEEPVLSSETAVTLFSMTGWADVVITALDKTIAVTVPAWTDVTALTAEFTLSTGATAAIWATPQVSGVTANDFTNPVTYVVTAEDGVTTASWVVTVTIDVAP